MKASELELWQTYFDLAGCWQPHSSFHCHRIVISPHSSLQRRTMLCACCSKPPFPRSKLGLWYKTSEVFVAPLVCQKLGGKLKKAHTIHTLKGLKALPTWKTAKETLSSVWGWSCSLSQNQDAEWRLKTQRSLSFLSWTTIKYVS